ncbi:MAG: TPM domain-containing protein, partial [Methylococcaceae bacterium]
VTIKRWFTHIFIPPWRWRLAFPKAVLKDIEKSVKLSEHLHRGEIRFAIENSLSSGWVWRGTSARQRATQVFSNLRVWDTEENSGVLIYVLLADREVHIVADRGISRRVTQADWDTVAQAMQDAFRVGDFRSGSLKGIEHITTILATHFPADADNPNELCNKPVIV